MINKTNQRGTDAVAWPAKHMLESTFPTAVYTNTAIPNVILNIAKKIL